MRRAAHRRRLAPLLLVFAAASATATLLSGIAGISSSPRPGGQASAVDMQGHPVQVDGGVSVVPTSGATPDGFGRLRVPSVGLDVPLGRLDAADGRITPPGFTSAYLVHNLGVAPADAAAGTVIVVMHSLRGGGVAPGNFLTDVVHARSKVHRGAIVTVAGVEYTVTGSHTTPKNKMAQNGQVWNDVANRLVLITCLERTDGSPSRDNLVITASRL